MEKEISMEQGKIKYASAEFTPRGEVKEGNVTWHTGTMLSAIESTKAAGGKLCALFFYGDVKDLFDGRTFFDDIMNATREEFEADPARYGLCYYKQPFTGGQWVYE